MTKIHDGPTIGYSTPAMAGPMTRLRFTWVELREMAPGRSVRPTRLGSTALHAGRLRALPMPMANTQANSAHRDGSPPNPTMAARTKEKIACSIWRVIRSSRRSNRSAKSPPNSPRSSRGPSWAKVSSPTKALEPVRS